MIIPVKYTASSGNTYDLNSNGIIHKSLPYRSFDWNAEGTNQQYGTRVAAFGKKAKTYKTELIFYNSDSSAVINDLHDDFERDIRQEKPGRITVGDYYIDCFILSSETKSYGRIITNKIEIFAPYPFWVQEFKISMPVSDVTSGEFLDFPFDFPFDFTAPSVGTKIVHSTFPFASEFRMIIYGQAVNPRITINGYPYVLYATIPSTAYVVIDSRTKSITQYNTDGTQTNMFNFRNKTDSIFQKVPGGNLTIAWDATFGVDLIVYHERSEPRIEATT